MKKLIFIPFVVLIGMVFAMPAISVAQETYTVPSGAAIDEKTAANLQSQLSAMKAILLTLQKEYAAKQAGNVSLPATLLDPREATALSNGLAMLNDTLKKLDLYAENKILSRAEKNTFSRNLTRIAQNLTSIRSTMAQPNFAIARENIASAGGSPEIARTEPKPKPIIQQEQKTSEVNAPVLEASAMPENKNQATASIAPLAGRKIFLWILVVLAAAALGFWLWKQWSRKEEIPFTDYPERKSAL